MAVPPAYANVTAAVDANRYPANIGILAMDIYFPRRCIEQSALEKHDGVSAGKYTIGLGQTQMAFIDDREDINSIALTAVRNVMEKYNISYKDIGRLEVGTETIIDKSKSVKTHLMDLFAAHGNTEIEGIATTNACYGGTSALFNAVQWIESSYWDGRYALVVAGDIAIYASGPARPTSGVGVVAMLVGPNAPLVMERGLRGTHMENVYDFYKPNLSSEFPVVDGPQSVVCYMRAVDKCYQHYTAKVLAHTKSALPLTEFADYACFHSPYAKIVQKAAGRLFLNDYLRFPNAPQFASVPAAMQATKLETSYFDKDVEKAFVGVSKDFFATRTEPSLLTCKMIGNMYCASLYGSLLSLLEVTPEAELKGKRILMFSYGSGLASSMFSLRVSGSVEYITKSVDLRNRLAQRTIQSPAVFEKQMELREKVHNAKDYKPTGDITDALWDGTYYLTEIDAKFRRTYARKEPAAAAAAAKKA
ncbi:hydroxymethylglutaryl-CoA synthase [Allomyces macrogynus ATCC 38327]|uniref:Hydroxymethylglutaryl-CoA synthase n=1 Tax=Allomyces macrogynus (strain ATCC 38327) TaxID=578462 RepID=A0A0L0T3H7_ALLM3|nr:hydroxymethylglutaryl-CoA synthase [Allomyces macrogynus ATCC 38327]|eukprot:KNE69271.1 hydroxymethylglutaryl-CoA synthase [Allomyces macrogynus ATCC 38327]